MIGLYIHVPFCKKKCHYCNFVIAAAGSAERHARFLSALEGEAAHRRASFRNISFDTLYIGGGTPSVMNLQEIEKVFAVLRENFLFRAEIEATFEANPGDING